MCMTVSWCSCKKKMKQKFRKQVTPYQCKMSRVSIVLVLNIVIIILQFSEQGSIKTSPSQEYQFMSLSAGSTSLAFKVMADDAIHVCLSLSDDQDEASMYEVYIGYSKNTKSSIKRVQVSSDGADTKQTSLRTPQILSATEFRSFWISWKDGSVKLGREGETGSILEFVDPQPLRVLFYGFRSPVKSSEWQFELSSGKDRTVSDSAGNDDSLAQSLEDLTSQLESHARNDLGLSIITASKGNEVNIEVVLSKVRDLRILIAADWRLDATALADTRRLLRVVDSLMTSFPDEDDECESGVAVSMRQGLLTGELMSTTNQLFQFFYDDVAKALASSGSVPVNFTRLRKATSSATTVATTTVKRGAGKSVKSSDDDEEDDD